MMAQLRSQRRVSMAEPVPDQPARRAPVAPLDVPPAVRQQARQAMLAHAAPVGPVSFHSVAPADGAIVGGRTTVRASIGGAPTRVVCEVDGVAIGTASGAAPAFSWNTRASGNGPHQVTLTATGPGGTSNVTLTLNVMNR